MERFVPNEFAWEFARNESEWIPGAVFVAIRDIECGEEIFYDYEWEHNINFIQYAQRGDILIDWPWYQTVDQKVIDPLIEPWLSYRDFVGETNKDWRLKKEDTISISPGAETLAIDGKESKSKDKQLLLDESVNGVNGVSEKPQGMMESVKGLFKRNGKPPIGWIDDNVVAVKREKEVDVGARPRRRQLLKKDVDSFEELDNIDGDRKVVKRKTVKKGQ